MPSSPSQSSGKIRASRAVRQLQARRAEEAAEEALGARRPVRVAGWRSIPAAGDPDLPVVVPSATPWALDTATRGMGWPADPLRSVPTWDVNAPAVPAQVRRIPRRDLALAGVLVTVLVAAAGLVATSGGDDRITIEDAAVSLTPAPSTTDPASSTSSGSTADATDPSNAEASGAPVGEPVVSGARERTRRSVGSTAGFDRRPPSTSAADAPDLAVVPVPPLVAPDPVPPPEPPVPSDTPTPTPTETPTPTPTTETPTSSTTTPPPPPPPPPPFPPLPVP